MSHPSPTLYFTGIHRVGELLQFPTKGSSSDSFPGDHGLLRYFGKKAFAIAAITSLLFALPRILIGAHWFTDAFVGALSIVLVGLLWVLLTHVSDRLINMFDRKIPGKHRAG